LKTFENYTPNSVPAPLILHHITIEHEKRIIMAGDFYFRVTAVSPVIGENDPVRIF
jgi:hypothetical protein